ncbi:MAG TPA: tRNA (adenosine(37)-N6)-threonylcarbamoyltransferase complex dimerization subunit type 1 TsaB [Hyphomonadaceae bacterium]|nr:tRNA (adenosine(37)-N6)-threonylcarbamoyltransferase complex dimerization subunit type 1 TsaB [Hyphomonadaceae bacterium]
MLVLGINTAGEACEAALVRDDVPVAARSEPMTLGHDARLAPLIEQLMREAAVGFDELDRIAVVVGPGSFTGVRVGVAFARGLSLASSRAIPAVGVSSLEALEGAHKDRRVLGLLPAKRRPPEKTWWAQVLASGRGISEPVEAREDDLRALAGDVDAIAGGLAAVPDLGKPRQSATPTAGAAAMFAAGLSGDLPAPRPIYVREPDAKPMARP